MNHWQTYKRVYIAAVVFVGTNAEAVDLVFGSLTKEQLQALSCRMLAVMICKCIAIASATLGGYLGLSKPQPPTP